MSESPSFHSPTSAPPSGPPASKAPVAPSATKASVATVPPADPVAPQSPATGSSAAAPTSPPVADPGGVDRGLVDPAAAIGQKLIGPGLARVWPGGFADRLTAPLPGFRDTVRMLRRDRPVPQDLSAAAGIPVRVQPHLPEVHSGQTSLTWVGHATFALRMGELTVLTDPVFSRRIPGVRARLTPPGVPLSGIGRVDAVVISHNHYDHLDSPTIKQLSPAATYLVPAGLAPWFRRRGRHNVIELDWWESAAVGDVVFTFVPAHHWSRRGLYDTCKTLWGGWLMTSGDSTVYFAGDTGYGHWFGEIGRRFPAIDLALMPIGAYEPNWFMKPVHLNPAEAVRACLDVGATRMATMHWGTFVLSSEPLLDPPRLAAQAWQAAGRPRADLWDLAVGESRTLHASRSVGG